METPKFNKSFLSLDKDISSTISWILKIWPHSRLQIQFSITYIYTNIPYFYFWGSKITENNHLNNPQTDQDLYHDPEALSPTFFFRWLGYFTKGKSSYIKTFFYEKLSKSSDSFFSFAKITFLYPPPSFWNIRICTYIHTSLNRFLGRSRYPQLNF